jgi:hypothetical protein
MKSSKKKHGRPVVVYKKAQRTMARWLWPLHRCKISMSGDPRRISKPAGTVAPRFSIWLWLTYLWKITMFNGKTHYKLPFSIAMLNIIMWIIITWYHNWLGLSSMLIIIHDNYHLVMTNSSPWKIPTINGGLVRWENHLFLWAMASMAM